MSSSKSPEHQEAGSEEKVSEGQARYWEAKARGKGRVEGKIMKQRKKENNK